MWFLPQLLLAGLATASAASSPAVATGDLAYSVAVAGDDHDAGDEIRGPFATLVRAAIAAEPRVIVVDLPPADPPPAEPLMGAPQLTLHYRLFAPQTSADGVTSIAVTVELREPIDGRAFASAEIVGRSDAAVTAPTVAYFEWHGERTVGQALVAAAGAVRARLGAELKTRPWTAFVVLNKNGRVYVNRGQRDQVVPGLVLAGAPAGAGEAPTRLETVKVLPAMTICKVVSGAADIAPGTRLTLAPTTPAPSR